MAGGANKWPAAVARVACQSPAEALALEALAQQSHLAHRVEKLRTSRAGDLKLAWQTTRAEDLKLASVAQRARHIQLRSTLAR